jgi:hypothetical protein
LNAYPQATDLDIETPNFIILTQPRKLTS